MWSSLAPLSPLFHDTVLGDISSLVVSCTNLVSSSSTRFICSVLDTAYPTLRPLALAFPAEENALMWTFHDALGQHLPCVLLELHIA